MKNILFLTFFVFSFQLHAQDVTGSWYGSASIQGVKLRIVFHIEKVNDGYSATMDSPDQGVKGIAVTSVRYENDSLNMLIKNIGFSYSGLVKNGSIEGKALQNGMELPLVLMQEEQKLQRPQEPNLPYPYISEEISFKNDPANITLAGTLTLPKKDGSFAAVVLINGSGPQNRDSEILGHKPFLVLADYLTKNGIAVLRFDERGVGKSEGNYGLSTSKDFAADVEAAVSYLKTRSEIQKEQIGLIGHSEGGMIAPMVAADKANNIRFVVLMAGPGLPISEMLLLQTEALMKASGMNESQVQLNNNLNKQAYSLIKNVQSQENLRKDLQELFGNFYDQNVGGTNSTSERRNKFVHQQMQSILSPWFQYFIKYNPHENLAKVTCPVLALNGTKDLQVTSEENLAGIEKSLKAGNNTQFTIKKLTGLNHLFQECKTCTVEEYAEIEQTLDPILLNEVSEWILQQVR